MPARVRKLSVYLLVVVLAAAASLFLRTPDAGAATLIFQAILNGANERPIPVNTPATGFAAISFDDITKLLSWSVTYQDLLAPIVASHFHGPATAEQVAGVQIGIGALPSPMSGSALLNPAQEGMLLAGLMYVNIHSTLFPAGEIRGQVTRVTPEPGSFLLLGFGLAAVGYAARRRKLPK